MSKGLTKSTKYSENRKKSIRRNNYVQLDTPAYHNHEKWKYMAKQAQKSTYRHPSQKTVGNGEPKSVREQSTAGTRLLLHTPGIIIT